MGVRTPSPRLPLFSLRLSASTKSRWQEAAHKEGRTLAGYIKHAVDHFLTLSQHVWHCEKCDRWQDVRSGCEADIRFDQRQIDARKVELAGCSCTGDTLFALLSKLPPTSQLTSEQARLGLRGVDGHGPQCPYTIADMLRNAKDWGSR